MNASVHRRHFRKAVLATSIAALLGGHCARAASATWLGATDAVWATDTNWSAAPAPGTGNTATFDGAGNGNVVLDLGLGVTIGSLLFNTASAAAYTIGAGAVGSQTLTLDNGGAITLDATVANNQLVNSALLLGNDGTSQTFTLTNDSATNLLTVAGGITGSAGATGVKTLAIAGAGAITLSGVIENGATGTVALTKAGSGTLRLSGPNLYTGGTTISSGTVIAQNSAAFGANGSTITLNAGATIDLGGGSTADSLNQGTRVFTISGTGVGGAGALVNNGGTQQINAISKVVLAGNTTFGGTSRWDIRGNTPTLNMNGNTITKVGTNVVSLVGVAVSNPGHAVVDAGTLSVETTTVLGGNSGNTFTVNNGGTLSFYQNNANVIPWSVSLNGAAATLANSNSNSLLTGPVSLGATANTLNVAGTNLFLGGAVTSTGSISKTGAGTAILLGNYTLPGSVSVTAGTLQLGNGGATGTLSTSAIPVSSGASLIFNRSTNLVQGTDFGDITGAGNFAQNGSGNVTFGTATAQTYTGQTRVNRGTLTLDFANLATPTNMVSASSVLNLGGGRLSVLGNPVGATAQTFASTTLSSGSSIIAPNRGTGTSTTITLGAVTSNAGSTLTFQPNTAWAAGANATTAGAASTTEIVTITGVTRPGGALTMPGAGSFGYIGSNAFNGSGTATRYAVARGAAAAPYQIAGGPTATAFVTTGGSASTVYSITAAQTLTGATTNYALIGNSAGAVTFANGGFGYTTNGFLNVAAGTITMSGTGIVTIGSERDFVINNASTGGLAVSSVIANNGGGASNVTVSSTGTGAFAPTGANTYSGITTVNSGSLTLVTDGANGAASSPLGAVPAAATAGKFVMNGGTLTLSPTAAFTWASNRGILLGTGISTITNTAAQTATIGAIIAGPGGVTFNQSSATGTLAVTGVNTYTGNTTLSGAGVIVPQNASAFGYGILTLNGAQMRSSTGGDTALPNVTNIAANTTFVAATT
jgi:autotransporter-associated beta strand protein